MPRKHHTPEEIIKLLRLVEIEVSKGETAGQACKQPGFTEQSYYCWRNEYGGLQINQAKRLMSLEKENARLKSWSPIYPLMRTFHGGLMGELTTRSGNDQLQITTQSIL